MVTHTDSPFSHPGFLDTHILSCTSRDLDICLLCAFSPFFFVMMLQGIYPSPSEVLPWFGLHNRTGFLLQGSVLKYCPRDLQQQVI